MSYTHILFHFCHILPISISIHILHNGPLKHPRLLYSPPQNQCFPFSVKSSRLPQQVFCCSWFSTRQHKGMCSHSLASIQNLPERLRKCPWALLPVTQLSAWFVTAPSDQNNCINKRRKALAVRRRRCHVRSLLNYNYETTNPLIVPPYGPRLDTCHCHMSTDWVISQERVFTPLASCPP